MANYANMAYDKAIADFSRAIQLNPHLAEAYNNHAFAFYHQKAYDKAGEDVHKAQDLKYSVQGVAGRSAEGAGEEKIRRERKNRHPACLCAPFPKIR